MSYLRVLPRDAFNESSLLKCIGKLTMLIEDGMAAYWTYDYDGGPFQIEQSQADGSLYVSNIGFTFKGERVRLYRPLNSRECWPLWCEPEDGDSYRVFEETGFLVCN
jgi:hypothetical protein